jgi:hypothetical protein
MFGPVVGEIVGPIIYYAFLAALGVLFAAWLALVCVLPGLVWQALRDAWWAPR